MTPVSRLYSERPVSAQVDEALHAYCAGLTEAISKAKADGLPVGFIVSVLHSLAHEETGNMVAMRS